MAISYFETAWNTAGSGSGVSRYKDVVVTGCQAGDVLVVFGAAEGSSAGTNTVVTQAGSTGAWTVARPSISPGNDVAFVAGWAVVSAAGSVTVRATLNVVSSSNHMGVAAFLIPAAEVGATYEFAATFAGTATGQSSLTLSASSTVISMLGDWNAATISSMTPAGGVRKTAYSGGTDYTVFSALWTGQAAGTRNYGPSSAALDASGAVFRMDTATGGPTTVTAAGGVSLGGTAARAVQAVRAASGGVSLSGTATAVVRAVVAAGGGVTLSGSADSATQVVATGGVSLGGTADATLRVATAAAGGLVLGGTAAAAPRVNVDAAGGVTLAGTAAVGGSSTAQGVITLGGTAVATPVITATATGGVSLAGTGVTGSGVITTASGGVTLDGTAARTVRIVTAAAGGVILTGTAQATIPGGTERDITMTGTLGPRQWAGDLTAHEWTGTISRRWGGQL